MTPYHDFYPGAKVVCIDDAFKHVSIDQGIRKGETYTLRWVGMYSHYIDGEFLGVKLDGIDRGEDPGGYGADDMPFSARRFRPLVRDKLATFRSLLAGGPIQGDFEGPRRRVRKREKT